VRDTHDATRKLSKFSGPCVRPNDHESDK